MSHSRPISREHALFAMQSADQPCLLQGRAGSGKSILLTELALSYLVQNKKVLHLSNLEQRQLKQHYVRYPHDIPFHNRLLHTRHGTPFTPKDVQDICTKYEELLSFSPDLIIVEDLLEIESSWKDLCTPTKQIWLSTTAEDSSIFPTISLVEVGSRIELHGDFSHGAIYINPVDQQIYEAIPEKIPSSIQTLYASGASGAEEAFGREAEKWNIKEIHYRFPGHIQSRTRGSTLLKDEELAKGTVSLHYVSRKLRRSWNQTPQLKKVLQVIWHIVHNSEQLFVVGTIQEDNTVHGGTGWSVELAQRWNKPVWVFDQEKNTWYEWKGKHWVETIPTITSTHFAGSGTRFLRTEGKKAIEDLFTRSFTPNPS